MTKLDMVLERIRRLPSDRQDALAADLELLLQDEGAATALSPDQQAELDRRLANPDTKYVPHDEVVAYFEKKFGR